MFDLQELKARIAVARAAAIREARADYRCIFSRGTFVATLDKDGQCQPCPEAEAAPWNGTKRELVDVIERCQREYPNVTKVYIAGGYDGAESPQAYREWGDYEPWVSAWNVDVWTKEAA